MRVGRLKTLKTRDDAMQAVLAEAAAKLPGLAKGSGYTSLLEGLILEALIQVAEAKVSVRGVAGQAAVTQKALTPAVAKFKEWALKNKGKEFASAIDVSFDSTGLTSGIGGVEVTTLPLLLLHPLFSLTASACFPLPVLVCPPMITI